MTQQEVNQQLGRITDTIVKTFMPEKIILFGSYAWGTPAQDSDLDLFVVKTTAQRRLEREQELRRALFGNDFPAMDLLVYTPQEVEQRLALGDFFIIDIIKNGKLLYETR